MKGRCKVCFASYNPVKQLGQRENGRKGALRNFKRRGPLFQQRPEYRNSDLPCSLVEESDRDEEFPWVVRYRLLKYPLMCSPGL